MQTGKMRGGSEWLRGLAGRHTCWMIATTGTGLFAVTGRLARAGLLTRGQSLRLLHCSMHLHGLAIRILRRQRSR